MINIILIGNSALRAIYDPIIARQAIMLIALREQTFQSANLLRAYKEFSGKIDLITPGMFEGALDECLRNHHAFDDYIKCKSKKSTRLSWRGKKYILKLLPNNIPGMLFVLFIFKCLTLVFSSSKYQRSYLG